jgi:hypothetical protein
MSPSQSTATARTHLQLEPEQKQVEFRVLAAVFSGEPQVVNHLGSKSRTRQRGAGRRAHLQRGSLRSVPLR